MKKTIYIDGMMCSNCAESVKSALKKLDGISNVTVELENKRAIVEDSENTSADDFKDAIENIGFDFIKAE